MSERTKIGFEEIEHTADWAVHVWAPDLAGLIRTAAEAMYALTGIRLESKPILERQVSLQGTDREDLLVAFLTELVYLAENEHLGFDKMDIRIVDDLSLIAHLQCQPVAIQAKEIKAVTYHNLAIEDTGGGLETTVVFDV